MMRSTIVAIAVLLLGVAAGGPARADETPADDAAGVKVLKEYEQFGGSRTDFEVAGRPAFVILPKRGHEQDRAKEGEAAAGEPLGWVWYAPQFAGVYPGERHAWIVGRVLDAGMACAGVDVGESFGNAEGRRLFTAFHRAATRRFKLSPRAVLLPQSRGGLMHYNWAAEHPDLVARIAGIYTVCDLTSWPGLDGARGAYAMTADELRAHLPACNPIERLEPLAKAKVPILHVHGDKDAVVPLERNSAELIRRYKALGGPGELVVVPGKGHEEVDEFFKSERLARFITTGQ